MKSVTQGYKRLTPEVDSLTARTLYDAKEMMPANCGKNSTYTYNSQVTPREQDRHRVKGIPGECFIRADRYDFEYMGLGTKIFIEHI